MRLGRQAEIAARVRDVPRKPREFKFRILFLDALYALYEPVDDVVYDSLLLEVERQRARVWRDEPRGRHVVRKFLVVVYYYIVRLYIVNFRLRILFVVVEHSAARAELGVFYEELHAFGLRHVFHILAVYDVRMPHLPRVVEQVRVGIRRPAHAEKVAVVGQCVLGRFHGRGDGILHGFFRRAFAVGKGAAR